MNDLPNPYKTTAWGRLPDGRTWGSVRLPDGNQGWILLPEQPQGQGKPRRGKGPAPGTPPAVPKRTRKR